MSKQYEAVCVMCGSVYITEKYDEELTCSEPCAKRLGKIKGIEEKIKKLEEEV